MNPVSDASVHTFPIGMAMCAAVAIMALLAWLAGLVLVLRGADPKDRPAILRAYALCRPPLAGVKRKAASQPCVSHEQACCPAARDGRCVRAMSEAGAADMSQARLS